MSNLGLVCPDFPFEVPNSLVGCFSIFWFLQLWLKSVGQLGAWGVCFSSCFSSGHVRGTLFSLGVWGRVWSNFHLRETAATCVPHDAFQLALPCSSGVWPLQLSVLMVMVLDDKLFCLCPNPASGSVQAIWARKYSKTFFSHEKLKIIHHCKYGYY